MVTISVKARMEPILEAMGALQLRQAPFALRWTVNALAREIADRTRFEIKQRFRTSSQGLAYLQRHVKILGSDSALSRLHRPRGGFDQTMSAAVGVIPPEGKGQLAGWSRYRGSLLPMLEGGGATPGPRWFGGQTGFGQYSVPVIRLGTRPRLPQHQWPIHLGLQARRSISGSLATGSLRGKDRTYLVRTGANAGMIFQRFGRERDDTMPLLATLAQTRLPARRFFYPTAQRIVDQRFELHFRAAMRQALFGRGSYRG